MTPSLTTNFGFQVLGAGDLLSTNGYKFTGADKTFLDALLELALTHHHSGAGSPEANPSVPLTLVQDNTQGNLPAGTRVYYKYTWVDGNGLETAASPEAYIDTPLPLATPLTPTLTTDVSATTLPPGTYSYCISAYSNATSYETLTSAVMTIATAGFGTVFTFPTIPAGATGWNVYRRGPGDAMFLWIASVVALGSFTDSGTAQNCNRTLPVSNTTDASNSVNATLPTAVPVGYTWKLYRTMQMANYTNSLVHWVVEYTVSTTIITPTFLDLGGATLGSTPPTFSALVSPPSQVDLVSEVTGRLQLANLDAIPFTVTFSQQGSVVVQTGLTVWVNEYPEVEILGMRAMLGVGSVPASTPVEVELQQGTGATPTYTNILEASVPVGLQIGSFTAPGSTVTLGCGDSLVLDVTQSGGGASPTDANLSVNVYMVARFSESGDLFA